MSVQPDTASMHAAVRQDGARPWSKWVHCKHLGRLLGGCSRDGQHIDVRVVAAGLAQVQEALKGHQLLALQVQDECESGGGSTGALPRMQPRFHRDSTISRLASCWPCRQPKLDLTPLRLPYSLLHAATGMYRALVLQPPLWSQGTHAKGVSSVHCTW